MFVNRNMNMIKVVGVNLKVIVNMNTDTNTNKVHVVSMSMTASASCQCLFCVHAHARDRVHVIVWILPCLLQLTFLATLPICCQKSIDNFLIYYCCQQTRKGWDERERGRKGRSRLCLGKYVYITGKYPQTVTLIREKDKKGKRGNEAS